MAFVDDLTKALGGAAHQAAQAASTAGHDLVTDVDQFVVPHLEDIAAHVAAITLKREQGIYTDATAKTLIEAQYSAVEALVETVVTLAVFEVQCVVNAIVGAVKEAVNGYLHLPLL